MFKVGTDVCISGFNGVITENNYDGTYTVLVNLKFGSREFIISEMEILNVL